MPNTFIAKIGLYTPRLKWRETRLDAVPSLFAAHHSEPTGFYLSLHQSMEGGVYRFQPLWDFDHEHDPNRSLDDARGFTESLSKEGIQLEDVMPFASGRKGIHLAGRYLLPPRKDWYEIFAHRAMLWQEEFPSLDAGIYQNRALIRAPWSHHQKSPTARKKPIPWEMFWRGSYHDILAWAHQPLTDGQWADIESLIREALPIEAEMPVRWTPFSSALVFDFRRHKLTQKAILAAKPIQVRRRFRSDWANLLDEAGIEYREKRTYRAGKIFALETCPCCGKKDKAYVHRTGTLKCFRTNCEAHSGIPAHVWTKDFGIELEWVDDETEQFASTDGDAGDKPEAELASALLRTQLKRIHNLQAGTTLLVKATPGLGKTTHMLDEVMTFDGPVLLTAATRQRAFELFNEYLERGGTDARLIIGRNADNCQNIEPIQIIGQKGYAPGKVFCPKCPFFRECDYYQQFSQPARVTFCTYEAALYLHDHDQLDADLIVLDEDPSRAFMREIALQIPHLLVNGSGLPLPVRKFTQFLRETLAFATANTAEKRAIYRSGVLKELFCLSAERMGIDLTKLLSQATDCLTNVYDKRGRLAGKSTEELEQIPPAYLSDLAQTILREAAHEDADFNSPLSVYVTNGVATLRFYTRFCLSLTTPLVILDAYGRAEYYRALLKREVETIDVQAKTYAKVIKIKLATSKRAFAARHDALFRRLGEAIAHHDGQQILVYTHAAVEEAVNERFPHVATQHFWAGRGVNDFSDYDVVLIFGTAEPNPEGLFDECRALYAHDPTPISKEPLADNHRLRKDSRLATLLAMRREEEMEQAAHRLRLVWAAENPKTVIVMSHLDLPGLPADEEIDPRAIESMNRKELLSQFIADCIEGMGFYCDALAELAGVVENRTQIVTECRERLACTASLMGNSIRNPVQPNGDGASMYPKNRNAYTRDRNAILSAMEFEEVSLPLKRASGQWITLKMWET